MRLVRVSLSLSDAPLHGRIQLIKAKHYFAEFVTAAVADSSPKPLIILCSFSKSRRLYEKYDTDLVIEDLCCDIYI